MSVEFQNQPRISDLPVREPKGMASKLVKMGVAKDIKAANTYLTVLALIFFALAVFIIL
jgi:hypothetical protein